jgi:dehydrogenase/reductase SDR family protein 12
MPRFSISTINDTNTGCESAKLTLTEEGVEKSFAVSFLIGSYYLGRELMPMLKKSTDPRVLLVATGGVYTTRLQPFPDALVGKDYNKLTTYARAKRAQVSVCFKMPVAAPT